MTHPYSKISEGNKSASVKFCCNCQRKAAQPKPKAQPEQKKKQRKVEESKKVAKVAPAAQPMEMDEKEFEKKSLEKIKQIEAEMKSINDCRNKRYQLLRKRRDGQKARMQMKLGKASKEKQISLLNDVI